MTQVFWPVGAGKSAALSATGAQALTINDQLTFVDGVTTQATGNRTLNLTINGNVKQGAIIHVASKTAGTETTVFGTGFGAATITGIAGKTFCQAFVFNGTTFLPFGLSTQID